MLLMCMRREGIASSTSLHASLLVHHSARLEGSSRRDHMSARRSEGRPWTEQLLKHGGGGWGCSWAALATVLLLLCCGMLLLLLCGVVLPRGLMLRLSSTACCEALLIHDECVDAPRPTLGQMGGRRAVSSPSRASQRGNNRERGQNAARSYASCAHPQEAKASVSFISKKASTETYVMASE